MPRVFLAARWRNLLMLNYRVEPTLLAPFVPAGTELDTWRGDTYLSLVAFLFADTRVLGVPIPWHRTFEEVNLRFYVRREVDGETRRAVTFLRETVPRSAIALVARLAYNEPYSATRMRHWFGTDGADGIASSVAFEWKDARGWTKVHARSTGTGVVPAGDSHESFITEHYWGYTKQRDGSTVEYQVTHPRWKVWPVRDARLTGPLTAYGPDFSRVLSSGPASAFLADGSAVEVFAPRRLSADELTSRRSAP